MRKHALSRGRLFVVCVLGALAGFVPSASADTALPVWTCRASAAYVEVNPLLAGQRIEPVLANGFPNRNTPDRETCSNDDTGLQTIEIPPNTESPLLTLEAASASTRIAPAIAPARNQTVDADAGIAETVRVTLAGLDVDAEAVTATARGTCVGTTPTLTSSSRILRLSINGTPILDLPQGGQGPLDINLGLVRIRLNQEQIVTAENGDRTLTRQAAHIELLPVGGGEPLARVVLGEVKVDFHGAVCAPPAPPPPCPAGFVAQNPNANPLVCLRTVTAPCPAGSTADPAAGGACVIIREVNAPCPAGSTPDPNRANACILIVQSPPANCTGGSVRDPATNNCVLIVERPCPTGSTPDPATRVCVATRVNNVGSGENGRIGSPDGPVATCGRLSMRFVRGSRNLGSRHTSRFGTRTVTRGRLVTCGSNPRPIVGARVDVVHVLPGNKRRRKTGLRSRANGLLTLILPIDLRTRNIEYAYRPDLRSTRVTSRVTLRLTVRNRAGRTLR
jgi:hypothetical protein